MEDSLDDFYNRQGVSAFTPGSGIGQVGTSQLPDYSREKANAITVMYQTK